MRFTATDQNVVLPYKPKRKHPNSKTILIHR